MKRTFLMAAACAAIAAGVPLAGCGSDDDSSSSAADDKSSLPQGSEPVTLDPADFTTDIDNPYLPLVPGSRWVYREREGGATIRVVITVTNETKQIEGITARVIRDTATENGELVEDTRDWYAQDADGNVWYMGEATTEYENGKPKTTEGSWQAGVDGAEPGIAMPGNPEAGQAYRQEYYKGHAEDRARVVKLDASVTVPFGHFDQALETEDIGPLGKKTVEHKYFVKNVGQVLAVGASGGKSREELLSFER
jgi:hypothetical protein